MSASPHRKDAKGSPRLLRTLGDDVLVVIEDMTRVGVGRSVGGTLMGLEAFYLSRDEQRQLEQLGRGRRLLRRTWWFVRGLLLKLTPARRIMLFVALLCILFGWGRFDFNSVHVEVRFGGLGTLLLFVVLVLELKDKLVARSELEAGRAVQIALMPTDTPAVPGWDVWLYTQPANDVGGDVVDHLPLEHGQHAVLLGDVTGKALPAALLAVKVQATLRALAPHFADLGELAAAVNRILYRDGVPTRFVSLVYAVLTADSGFLRLLIAGHMPPLLCHERSVTTLPQGSMVIGMMPDVPFWEQSVTVESGDLLVVYSDGVSEAMNDAEEFFGEERLHALVSQAHGMPAAEAGRFILDGLAGFVGLAEQSDDVSLMVLRRI